MLPSAKNTPSSSLSAETKPLGVVAGCHHCKKSLRELDSDAVRFKSSYKQVCGMKKLKSKPIRLDDDWLHGKKPSTKKSKESVRESNENGEPQGKGTGESGGKNPKN